MHLDLSGNKVKNLTIFTNEECFLNLKYLDISDNKFNEFAAFKLPKLEYLDVSKNKLEKVNADWKGHENIRILKSVDNKFKTLQLFSNMPKLEQLYVAKNAIQTFTQLEGVPNLKRLHMRENKIDKFPEEEEEMISLPALEYLNLRKNKLVDKKNLMFIFNEDKFPMLTDLNVYDCPVEKSYSSLNIFIGDVLIKNPKILRFCKVSITDQLRLEAVFLGQYKWEKEEAERKRLEEEERKR